MTFTETFLFICVIVEFICIYILTHDRRWNMEEKTEFMNDKELEMLFQTNTNNFIAKQRQFNKVNTEFSKKTTTLLKQLSDDYIQTREEIHKMNSKIDRLTVFLILTLCLLLWSVFIWVTWDIKKLWSLWNVLKEKHMKWF